MAEQQGIPVSRARVAELLAQQQANSILQLQQQVAELTAVNEALMGRLNEQHNASANSKALSEGILDASSTGNSTP